MTMYQRPWGLLVPPRRQHFCRARMVFHRHHPPQLLRCGFILDRQPSLRPTNGQSWGLLRSARIQSARRWSKPLVVQPPSRVTQSPSRHQTEVSTRSRLVLRQPFRDHRHPKPAPFRPRRFDALDGLLHFDPWPALSSRPPRPRFSLQGLVPHSQRDRLVTRRCPLVVGTRCLPVSPPAPTSSAPPSGLCSVSGSVARARGFSPYTDPRPSWVCLPSGSSSRTVKVRLRSRTFSIHSLGDHPREGTTSGFRRVTDSRPGWLP
jgi:hypothetical protein